MLVNIHNIHIHLFACLALGVQLRAAYGRVHGSQLRVATKSHSNDAYFIEATASSCVAPAETIITPDECDEAAEVLGLVLGYRGDWNLGGHCAKWPVLNMDTWYYHYASGQVGASPICKLPEFTLTSEIYCEPGESGPQCPDHYSLITATAECDEAGSKLGFNLGYLGDVNYGGTCSKWHGGYGFENWYYYYAGNQCGAFPICSLEEYILSSGDCPPGYATITSASVCDIAGAALGLGPGFITGYGFGGNCAKYELGGQSNVYYHFASNQPGATPICAAVTANPPEVPTPAPTSVRTDTCAQLTTGSVVNDWQTICSAIPTDAGHIQLTMGDVIDFFRPVTGSSFCDMLTSSNRHEWSNDLTTWHIPDYFSSHVGGSATNWPLDNVAGDDRRYLSFWGDGRGGIGGCCHNSYSDASFPGRQFTMYWCVAGANHTPVEELPTSTGEITATGDPHLKNIFGERFDLMRPGRHVLVNIPRGEPIENTYLHVEADASRLGGECADLYFQELNITGSLAEEKQAGGYYYHARGDSETSDWQHFGKIYLKIVHGRTEHGIEYLNFYVKHLKRAGFAVGGLLGEDDHSQVEIPPEACIQHVTL